MPHVPQYCMSVLAVFNMKIIGGFCQSLSQETAYILLKDLTLKPAHPISQHMDSHQ